MLEYQTIFIMLLLGVFVGFIAGLFGIGGGGILVPILSAIFLANKIPENQALHLALGTSMACIVITSFSSFRTHSKHGFVYWHLFWLIAPGVVIGTFLGSFIATRLSSVYLAIIFFVFMSFSSFRMFFSTSQISEKENLLSKKLQILAGMIIGIISSLVSIGGGILSVPFINFQGVDIKKAIGTSAAIGFPLAISGTLGYIFSGFENTQIQNFTLGYVNLTATFFITTTSFFFAPLGARLSHKIPSKNLKKIFAILPFVLSIKMLFQFI